MKLRLVHVATVNFQSSDATNIQAEIKGHGLRLGPHDCGLLFSMRGNQCVFFRAPTAVELNGQPNTLYVSSRFRLEDARKETSHASNWVDDLPEFFAQCEAFGMDITSLRTRVMDFFSATGATEERRVRSVG